jgi:ABC-type Co2+ transport system permease subunit
MDEAGVRELTFILISIAFFLALALVAVWLFIRQYRREKEARKKPAE